MERGAFGIEHLLADSMERPGLPSMTISLISCGSLFYFADRRSRAYTVDTVRPVSISRLRLDTACA